MIESLFEEISQIIEIDSSLLLKGAATLFAFLLYWILRRSTDRLIQKRYNDPRQKFQLQKSSEIINSILVFLLIWQIWLPSLTSLATYLGLLSAVIAIALKDPIANLFGWLFIVWRKLFEVGDRIEIDKIIGDVVDQKLFSFSLMEIGNWVEADQSTGRMVYIPNAKVFTAPLFSYSAGIGGYIWNELPILITFESNWNKAKTEFQIVMNDYFIDNPIDEDKLKNQQNKEKFLVHHPISTPIIYTSIKDSGVLLTLRFLCKPQNRRIISTILMEKILKLIDGDQEIALSYPTQRIVLDEKNNLP